MAYQESEDMLDLWQQKCFFLLGEGGGGLACVRVYVCGSKFLAYFCSDSEVAMLP